MTPNCDLVAEVSMSIIFLDPEVSDTMSNAEVNRGNHTVSACVNEGLAYPPISCLFLFNLQILAYGYTL